MNLLPKSSQEFGDVGYWDTFFKKRGGKAFEWYGEYFELCHIIHKYIKLVDKILIVGCGNSKLSMDMYDGGFKDIINIDISQVVIKNMVEQNECTRSDMKFLQMDATQMEFENESFSVILDKGTLDALMTDDKPETQAIVEKYFNEIVRTMRNGGRYVCISLLQEHILRYVLNYFPQNSFMVRIVRCLDAELSNQTEYRAEDERTTMPVFVVVATKFKALSTPILEFSMNNEKMQRLQTTEELLDAVLSLQRAAMICNGLARANIADLSEVTMDLCTPGEDMPRYTVYILDQQPARNLAKYAAFIVPQGREIEWLFSTPQGRKKLLHSAGYQRLAIITLHRDNSYNSLDEVKCELGESIKNFAPAKLTEQIPFLSLGSDVGKRNTLVSGFSKLSGDFRVEEVEGEDGKIFRRLIFLSNQFVVQSEALVKIFKTRGKKEKKKIDVGYLACQHHSLMAVGVQMSTQIATGEQKSAIKDVLVVGLGGGGLCSFLHAAMQNISIIAVEIDPIMLEVAEQYFELKQDKRLHVVVDDGINFIDKCKTEGFHFNAILFDVDSKDLTLGMSCPPQSFLTSSLLSNIKDLIGNNGVFILNLVCRDEELRQQAIENLRDVFLSVCCYKLVDDLNEVIFCCNNEKYKDLSDWQKVLSSSCRNLNNLTKTQKVCDKDIIDVKQIFKNLKI